MTLGLTLDAVACTPMLGLTGDNWLTRSVHDSMHESHPASVFRYNLEATDTLLIALCLCVAYHGVSEAKYAAIDTMSSTVRLATGPFMSCAAVPARAPLWMS